MTRSRQKFFIRRHKFDDVLFGCEIVSYRFSRPRKILPLLWRRVAMPALVAILFVAVGANYGRTGETVAVFSDTETSSGNRFAAIVLDFLAYGGGAGKVTPTAPPIEIPFNTSPAAGSSGLNYRVKIENIAGTMALCNALSVTVKDSIPFAYTGPIAGLNGTATTSVAMILQISLPSDPGVLSTDQCTFDIVARAWNQYVPENTGYSDEERVGVVITDPPFENLEAEVGLLEVTPLVVEEETPTEEPEEKAPSGDGGGSTEPVLEETPPAEEVVEESLAEEANTGETLPVEPTPEPELDSTSSPQADTTSPPQDEPVVEEAPADSTPSTPSTSSGQVDSGQASSPQAEPATEPDSTTSPQAEPASAPVSEPPPAE
ncbi:MAG: hypothetical protein WBL19_00610 [Minisyncoccia bacterium]